MFSGQIKELRVTFAVGKFVHIPGVGGNGSKLPGKHTKVMREKLHYRNIGIFSWSLPIVGKIWLVFTGNIAPVSRFIDRL